MLTITPTMKTRQEKVNRDRQLFPHCLVCRIIVGVSFGLDSNFPTHMRSPATLLVGFYLYY